MNERVYPDISAPLLSLGVIAREFVPGSCPLPRQLLGWYVYQSTQYHQPRIVQDVDAEFLSLLCR